MTDGASMSKQTDERERPCGSRSDDAMELLRAMGHIDEKFVLESSAPCGQGQAEGGRGRLAVFESAAARRGLAGGLGLAACLLAAGLVVFGGQSGSVTQTFEQVATTQVSEEAASPETPGEEASADDAAQRDAADAILLAAQSVGSEGEGSSDEGSDDEGSDSGARAVQDDDADEPVVASSASSASSAESSADDDAGDGVSLAFANPWQECRDLQEAATLAGFELSVGQAPQGSVEANTYIQVIPDDIIEVDYHDALGERVAYVRKAKGSEDASGDYNAYDLVQTLDVEGVQVEVRGSDAGWSCVVWAADGYSYAIGFSSPASTEQVEALVSGIG